MAICRCDGCGGVKPANCGLALDDRDRTLARGDKSIPVTNHQTAVLAKALAHPGAVATFDGIAAAVWGRLPDCDAPADERKSIVGLVFKLNKHLRALGVQLENVRGIGYRVAEFPA